MKYLFILWIIIVSSFSYGETFSTSNLTKEQAVQLEKYAADLKLQQMTSPVDRAKEISEWVSVGEQIGKGLAGCAKELGVEVNNFVQTPVGKFASAVIIWKLMGRDIVHFGFGLLFFIFCSVIWVYLYRRMCLIESITYGEQTSFWKRRSKTVKHYAEGRVDGTRLVMMVAALAIAGLTAGLMFS